MAVVYKKSELGTFIEQLPSLIMQYQSRKDEMDFQKELLEDKQAHEIEMLENKNKLDLELIAYSDAKDERKEVLDRYNVFEQTYLETGAELEDLNNLYRTNESLNKLLDDISKSPAETLLDRAELLGQKTELIEQKINILQDVVFDDIRKAQQIIIGGVPGVGYKGGKDPERYDVDDLNYKAYKSVYGENKLVENYFKANPGTIAKSMQELESDLINTQTTAYRGQAYKSKTNEEVLNKDYANAKEMVATNIRNSSYISGLDTYYISQAIAGSPDEYDNESIERAIESQTMIRDQISFALSELLNEEFSEENKTRLFERYRTAHALSVDSQETDAVADYAYMNSIIDDAYNNYSTKSPEVKRQLDNIAQQIFGFSGGTFEDYYGVHRNNISMLVSGLSGADYDILDPNDINSENFEDLFND
jgi:hypothetical protein